MCTIRMVLHLFKIESVKELSLHFKSNSVFNQTLYFFKFMKKNGLYLNSKLKIKSTHNFPESETFYETNLLAILCRTSQYDRESGFNLNNKTKSWIETQHE